MDFPTSSAESIHQVMNTGPFVQGPQSGTNFGIFLDMRAANSFYLDMSAVVVGSPSEHVPILVVMRWFFDTQTSQVSYQDTFEYWADNLNPTQYFFAGGVMSIQDVVHGPFLQITVSNGALTTSATLSITVVGTSRTLPNQYVRQQASSDGIIGNSVATITGGNAYIPCCIGYGNTQFIFQNNSSTTAANWFVKYGSKQNIVVVAGAAPLSQIFQSLIVPKRAPLITATLTPNGTQMSAYAINQMESH